jgi:hypothetical protein
MDLYVDVVDRVLYENLGRSGEVSVVKGRGSR